MSGGSEAKKHAPSETKLRKQRDEGSVASGQDSAGLLASAGGLLVLLGMAAMIWDQMQAMIIAVIDLINEPFDAARQTAGSVLTRTAATTVGPVVAMTLAVAVLTTVVYNKGVLFSMKPVKPQLSRISPTNGLKRIFGRRGLIETSISLVRIVLWLTFAVAAIFLPMLALARDWTCSGLCLVSQLLPVAHLLVIGAVVALMLAAGTDMFIQRQIFLHEQKMTDTERKNERRDQNGSPEIRQERRRRMREANQPRRMPDPANATMCFWCDAGAVAIEFKPPEVPFPYVVAQAATATEVRALRNRLKRSGWPDLHHQSLTAVGLRTSLGTTLPEEVYSDFVVAVQAMFRE